MDLDRLEGRPRVTISGSKRVAAVLVPVIEHRDGYSLLFTKRADDLGEHPGQMSFPGGGRERSDRDLLATALREAKEEIALDPTDVHIFGALDDILTVTDYSVTPFVGQIPAQTYTPNEREVAEIVILPVGAFFDPANYEVRHREHPHYGTVPIHHFHIDGYTVWGATGRIVVQFLNLVTDCNRLNDAK